MRGAQGHVARGLAMPSMSAALLGLGRAWRAELVAGSGDPWYALVISSRFFSLDWKKILGWLKLYIYYRVAVAASSAVRACGYGFKAMHRHRWIPGEIHVLSMDDLI